MALTPNSFTDATVSPSRATRKYKDISLSFTRHPITGDIATLSDADAVKRSVRNLIQTDFYERPFHPEIGSDVRKILFEPVDESTAMNLSTYIEECITNYEPRAALSSVRVDADTDRNGYHITIEFYIVNSEDGLISMDVDLERLR
jgi:phage baseplate assembly protein W